MNKPWFRKQNNTWYVSLDGRQVNLGKDEDEAEREWHRLMAGRGQVRTDTLVCDLFGQFLDWCERNRDRRTYDWYAMFIQDFASSKYCGRTLALQDLKPFHVANWVENRYGRASQNTRNCAIRALVRPFNWALKLGHIERNPVAGIERPEYEPRECYIEAHEWEKLLAAVSDDEFRDFLTILRETGCRPQEARAVEARHFDRRLGRWVFPKDESKGKKRKRVVPLNTKALAITQRLVLKHPEGKLFRNTEGNPWTAGAIHTRFQNLGKKLNIKTFAYAIRHTFITDALLRGVEPMDLATIVGHKDLKMIWTVYQHLGLHDKHIKAALRKATGEEEVA